MRRYVQDLQPESIKDLAAMVALYRPGPMQHIPTYIRAKHGRTGDRYPHPDLAEILDETYGVIVYQDQVLLIAQKFAGYSLGAGGRHAQGDGQEDPHDHGGGGGAVPGGRDRAGLREEDCADEIFKLIEPFAGYAFNKAHSVSYGTIAYQTAYLKANYPEEYMTAVMMMAGGAAARRGGVRECVRLGIPVLPPDVNHSDGELLAGGAARRRRKAIRFGLAHVKNVGEGMAEGIVEERDGERAVRAHRRLLRARAAKYLNKRALESLVKAGAFDALAERASLLASARPADRVRAEGAEAAGRGPDLAVRPDERRRSSPRWQGRQLENVRGGAAAAEAGVGEGAAGHLPLGAPVRATPRQELRQLLTCSIVELNAELAGRDVIIGGIIAGMRTLNTKDGRAFLAVEIEDQTGSIEVTVWPETYEQTRELWQSREHRHRATLASRTGTTGFRRRCRRRCFTATVRSTRRRCSWSRNLLTGSRRGIDATGTAVTGATAGTGMAMGTARQASRLRPLPTSLLTNRQL